MGLNQVRRAFAAVAVIAGVAYAATGGPRVERVIVEKIDGTTRVLPAPAPRPLTVRAIPGPEELARLERSRTRPVAPASPPAPDPARVALGAPVGPQTAPVALTGKDRQSLRWLRRLRAKFPDRFDRMMVDNPRARWLVGEESKLGVEEREALHEEPDRGEREDDDDG